MRPYEQCELTSMFREWSKVQSHDVIEHHNTTQRTTSGQKVNKTSKTHEERPYMANENQQSEDL